MFYPSKGTLFFFSFSLLHRGIRALGGGGTIAFMTCFFVFLTTRVRSSRDIPLFFVYSFLSFLTSPIIAFYLFFLLSRLTIA